MTNVLKAEVRYFPYALPKLKWKQQAYWFDEIKMNLLWLACPEIDEQAGQRWQGNAVSEAIDTHLSQDIRKILSGPPIEFMRDFVRIDDGSLVITDGWPVNYHKTMWTRAKEANTRLCAELAPNVYKVDFVNGRRFG